MKLIIFILMLSSQVAISQEFSINPVADTKKPFLRLEIENQSDRKYFCRDITLKDADYYFAGTKNFLTSLDAKITNKYIDKKSKYSFLQDPSSELDEILKDGYELDVDFENTSLIQDCELKESRMNNIYVLDDQASCGGSVALKKFIFDGINLKLENTSSMNAKFDKNAKFFKLNARNSIIVQTNKKILLIDITGESFSEAHEFAKIDLDEVLVGAFAIKDSFITLVTYSTENGIRLKVYSVEKNDYKLVAEKVLSTYALKSNNLDSSITNTEEIASFYRGQLDKMAENISVYSNHVASHSVIEVNLLVRMPSDEVVIADIVNGVPKKKLRPIEISENLDVRPARVAIKYSSGIEFTTKIELEMEETFELINKSVLVNEGLVFNQINFKEYQITASKDNILISNKKDKKKISGFCNVRNMFSDVLISSGEFDINQMYDGRPILVTAVRDNKSYAEILKIISLGGNVNLADRTRMTPLYYAVRLQNIDTVTLLLENGADPDFNVGSESLFSFYIDNVLQDFEYLQVDERKVAAATVNKMLNAFTKYNYSFKKDRSYKKHYDVITKMENPIIKKMILSALEIE